MPLTIAIADLHYGAAALGSRIVQCHGPKSKIMGLMKQVDRILRRVTWECGVARVSSLLGSIKGVPGTVRDGSANIEREP